MPCYDHRDSPDYIYQHTVKPLEARIDELAQWLCAVMLKVPAEKHHELPPELRTWWREHQVFDANKGER